MFFATPGVKVWQFSLITVVFKRCCLDNQGEIQLLLDLFMDSLLVQGLREASHTLDFCIGSSKESPYLSWITHTNRLHFCVHGLFYVTYHSRLVRLLNSNGFTLRHHEVGKEGGERIKTTGKQRPSLYSRETWSSPDFPGFNTLLISF